MPRLLSPLRLKLPPRKHLQADLAAGAIGGVAAVPDGLASAVMAGVNPVFGIYGSIFGRIAGGSLHARGCAEPFRCSCSRELAKLYNLCTSLFFI